jgi:hypothetical protein
MHSIAHRNNGFEAKARNLIPGPVLDVQLETDGKGNGGGMWGVRDNVVVVVVVVGLAVQ